MLSVKNRVETISINVSVLTEELAKSANIYYPSCYREICNIWFGKGIRLLARELMVSRRTL